MNIYDFAGNEWEWTLEHAISDNSSPCVFNGGYFNSPGDYHSASYRGNNSTNYSVNSISFRGTLYK